MDVQIIDWRVTIKNKLSSERLPKTEMKVGLRSIDERTGDIYYSRLRTGAHNKNMNMSPWTRISDIP